MELEFFINPKMEKQTVYISSHNLRFKMKLVNELSIKDGDIMRVGLDKTEKPLRHFYVLKANNDDTVGFKVTIRNNSAVIAFKGMKQKLQIDKAQNCRYELIEVEGMKGIKVKLPEA